MKQREEADKQSEKKKQGEVERQTMREGGREIDRGDKGKEGEIERRVSGREWRGGEVRREGKEQADGKKKKGKG